MTGVYLIHFEKPFEHARHYLGYADNIERRFKLHQKGRAARLTQVVTQSGIGLILARVWEGKDRNFERRLKNQNNGPRLCPICREAHNE